MIARSPSLHAASTTPLFSAPYAADDDELIGSFLAAEWRNSIDRGALDGQASMLIEGIRANSGGIGGLEDFLRDYGLSTKEGLALMVMAEALLRVPDAATQGALIEEKISAGDWSQNKQEADTWFVSAATWGLGISSRIVTRQDKPEGIVGGMVQRLGRPAVRTGVRHAMTFLGHQFVLGQTIADALHRAKSQESEGFLYSYDMLGEGARDWKAARRYKQSYADAIDAIGRGASGSSPESRPGISVKLSALHPKYNARNRDEVLTQLVPDLVDLARMAAGYDLNFTVDAEEADRLELSLQVIAKGFAELNKPDWGGFGLALQAYQKRAHAVVDWANELAVSQNSRLMVRLVKGAYWDSEIKQAQQEGLPDIPVFTRKAATDVSYHNCAAQMFGCGGRLYPQFATHNALTVATILQLANGRRDFEFQRLHGMGESLYEQVSHGIAGEKPATCRIYAPVGGHKDLLAYLVRRLLENGANSSFVAQVTDKSVPIANLLQHPGDKVKDSARHPKIKRSSDLFAGRKNSAGFNFGSETDLNNLLNAMEAAKMPDAPQAFTADKARSAVDTGRKAFPDWARTSAEERAACLERTADLLEQKRDFFMALLAREAGKTPDDGIAEIREAVDFCRYYAIEARRLFVPNTLPGPVGELNEHQMHGRGVFVCISPWNFPLAIFLGQVSAALAAGNAVIAKPAVQTPSIAAEAVRLLHEAGVPSNVVQLVPGGAEVGEALVTHHAIAGVAFTGSTGVAKLINRQLAEKDGPIVPLIAETGGINAMIVDATALPEQVCDDVIKSAFRSAGQRCSALRVLYLQEEIYESVLSLIQGASETLAVGDPLDPATDVGPIIDAEALGRLVDYLKENQSRVRYRGTTPDDGTFLAPHILEFAAGEKIEREVFGPVLHVKKYKAGAIEQVMNDINSSGYGLTFGVHSRIDGFTKRCAELSQAGNVYINRDTIGAIVGSQPFGGSGLSGTGPKAGGPNYLARFAEERTISTDTTAAGGNASLIALEDDL